MTFPQSVDKSRKCHSEPRSGEESRVKCGDTCTSMQVLVCFAPAALSMTYQATLRKSSKPSCIVYVHRRFFWYNAPRSSGRGAARLAHLHGVQGVGGSNPLAPTRHSGVPQLRNAAFCFQEW